MPDSRELYEDARNQPTVKLGQRIDIPDTSDKPPFSSELGTKWGESFDQSRLIGDYELLEKIGSGGMGVVYKARQLSLNRIVAFKTISARKLTKEKAVARFDKEAKVVATLDHPGIVPVYDVGADAGRLYFAMEYVDGASLHERLRSGPISPRNAAEIVAELADAIQHAHEKGIIHRDLKPSNVLIDKSGRARIIDFGLAIRLADGSGLTTTNAVVGTPNYMAPERATADLDKVGVRSDIYSLGAILYECLVGKPPFVASTPARTMELLVHAELVAPAAANPTLPKRLNNICLRCLKKDPAVRYQSAKDLARDLRQWLAGEESTESIRVSSVEATSGSDTKSRILNVVLLVLLAIVSSLLAYTTYRLQNSERQLREIRQATQGVEQ